MPSRAVATATATALPLPWPMSLATPHAVVRPRGCNLPLNPWRVAVWAVGVWRTVMVKP